MKYQAASNYLKAHRKRSGLSQRDVGKLLGYRDPGQISRHERAMSVPPLEAALAYEMIFRTPVAAIFSDMRETIARDIEPKLREMKTGLENRGARDRNASLIAQKLAWLNKRQNAQEMK